MRSHRNTPPAKRRGFTGETNEPGEPTRYIVLRGCVERNCRALQRATDRAERLSAENPEDSYLVIGYKHGHLRCNIRVYADLHGPGRPTGGPTRGRMMETVVLEAIHKGASDYGAALR